MWDVNEKEEHKSIYFSWNLLRFFEIFGRMVLIGTMREVSHSTMLTRKFYTISHKEDS